MMHVASKRAMCGCVVLCKEVDRVCVLWFQGISSAQPTGLDFVDTGTLD